jgi:hypothetical protein
MTAEQIQNTRIADDRWDKMSVFDVGKQNGSARSSVSKEHHHYVNTVGDSRLNLKEAHTTEKWDATDKHDIYKVMDSLFIYQYSMSLRRSNQICSHVYHIVVVAVDSIRLESIL